MPSLIALFALAFQLSASNPKALGDCYTSKSGPLVITEGMTFAQCEAMKGMWHQRTPTSEHITVPRVCMEALLKQETATADLLNLQAKDTAMLREIVVQLMNCKDDNGCDISELASAEDDLAARIREAAKDASDTATEQLNLCSKAYKK